MEQALHAADTWNLAREVDDLTEGVPVVKVAGQVRHAVDHVDHEVVRTEIGSSFELGSDLTGDASILPLAGAEGSCLHVLRRTSGPRSRDSVRGWAPEGRRCREDLAADRCQVLGKRRPIVLPVVRRPAGDPGDRRPEAFSPRASLDGIEQIDGGGPSEGCQDRGADPHDASSGSAPVRTRPSHLRKSGPERQRQEDLPHPREGSLWRSEVLRVLR